PEFVRLERSGGVTTITIDRPPVNALSRAVVGALESALDTLATDTTTRVALLRGAGPRGFSAGADISEFPALLEPNADTRGEGIQRLADHVEAFPKPLIVAIHGFCMGGGLEIALACDIRIAAEDAQIGLPEVRIGILPGGGGTQRLPRAVGPGRARLMIFSGEPISGRRAAEWGLVEEVVAPAEVFDTAAAIARTLAAQSPYVLAVIKALLRETSGAPLRDGLRTETAAFARLPLLRVGPQRDRDRRADDRGRELRRRDRRRPGVDHDASERPQPEEPPEPVAPRPQEGHLHADGPDRGGRRRALRRYARSPGRIRARLPTADSRGPARSEVRRRDPPHDGDDAGHGQGHGRDLDGRGHRRSRRVQST